MKPLRIRKFLLLGDGNTWKRKDLDSPPFSVGAVVSVGCLVEEESTMETLIEPTFTWEFWTVQATRQ